MITIGICMLAMLGCSAGKPATETDVPASDARIQYVGRVNFTNPEAPLFTYPGVQIIAGDTKVAGKGQVDGIFITTTGVGLRLNGVKTGGSLAKPGDAVIVTGNIGQHGCCILIERNEFGINADVKSDCAPLCNSVLGLLNDTKDVHVIRDATRGGVGTVLYEIAEQSKTGIKLFQDKVPVSPEVKGVCGMLGLEPLYLACEGSLVIFAPKENAENILASLKKQKYTESIFLKAKAV